MEELVCVDKGFNLSDVFVFCPSYFVGHLFHTMEGCITCPSEWKRNLLRQTGAGKVTFPPGVLAYSVPTAWLSSSAVNVRM